MTNPETEIALVDLARQGDRQALETLVRLWGPRIRRFAARLCPATEVLDAVQETLLILATQIGALRSSEALVSWSFQIVRRHCIRIFSQFRRDTAIARELGYLAPDPADARPDQVLLLEELGRILASLPTRDREVLVLKDIEGLSIRDTGGRLGLTEIAVKSRLHRARVHLRERMLRY